MLEEHEEPGKIELEVIASNRYDLLKGRHGGTLATNIQKEDMAASSM